MQYAGQIFVFQGEFYSTFPPRNKKPGMAPSDWVKPLF